MTFARVRLVCLFLFLFAVYVSGQAGVIPSYRDAGDFIAAIPQLGIPHPPGYPLYVLLGRIALLVLPWANAAYRLHLLSAACAALAAVICVPLLRRWGFSEGVSYFCVVLWALSPAVIALARVSEMYTLAALAAVAVLWAAARPEAPAPLTAFLLGIATVAHPTLIFLAPLVWTAAARTHSRREIAWASAMFAAGLSLYLFLPLRAAQAPFSNWGDPSHWRNFWRVVTRADYGGLRLHPVESRFTWTTDDLGRQLAYFFTTFGRQWRWIGLVAGIWALLVGRRSLERRIWWGALAAWTLMGPGFLVLANLPLNEPTTPAILQPYLLVAGVLWLPFAAAGFSAVEAKWPRFVGRAVWAAAIGCMCGLGAIDAWAASQRGDFYAYDYGRNLYRSLPPRAVLYDPDDPTAFTVRALQVTEGRRPDIATLNFFRTRWGYERIRRLYPDLLPDGDVPNAQYLEGLFWSYSARRRPFFVELPQKLEGLPYSAEGLVYAVESHRSPQTLRLGANHFELYVARGPLRTDLYSDFFTRHLIDYYAAAHTNLGLDEAAAGYWEAAIDQYKAAVVIDPELAAAYNDWAVAEYNRHHYASAVLLYRHAVALEPDNAGFLKNLELAEHAF